MMTPSFINRELSWLEFNSRVLDEARDPSVPLLERLRFLAIFSSNLDEFFMVRVAGLRRQLAAGVEMPGVDGRTPREVLHEVSARTHDLVAELNQIFVESLVPALRDCGVRLLGPEDWTVGQRGWLRRWFRARALPTLRPFAVGPACPAADLPNRSVCLVVRCAHGTTHVLPLPVGALPRFLQLPAGPGEVQLARIEDVVRMNLESVFPNLAVIGSGAARVTRDAELDYDLEQEEDLPRVLHEAVCNRSLGAAVRLQHEPDVGVAELHRIARGLGLEASDLYEVGGITSFSDLFQLCTQLNRPDLKFPVWAASTASPFGAASDPFAVIDRGDVLLHHPYQSFDPVIEFLEAAALDPLVLAIKITLYRVGPDSGIGRALLTAARLGKSVVVLIELRARFNEESNMEWARRLESAGAHVVFGAATLKTHAKVALVVRGAAGAVQRYAHLSTGNYNEGNARTYTDFSLFTSRVEVAQDVEALFNLLSGDARPPEFRVLLVAPVHLRSELISRIRREAAHAQAGRTCGIVVKLNALVDPELIDELYQAGQAGVRIYLIIRGICCLRAGVPGFSENLHAIRIVDRFLEHARVFRFENGGERETWLSSADWMPRNLNGRIEVAFPVNDSGHRQQIDALLELQLADNVKASRIGPDGTNARITPGGARVRSQEQIMRLAQGQ